MSSIYSNNGYLYYSYSYKDEKGKYKRKTESLKLKDTRRGRVEARAIQKVRDKYYESKRLEDLPTAHLTLEKGAKQFLETKKNKRPGTIKNYEQCIKPLLKYFDNTRYIKTFKKNEFIEYEYYLMNLGLSKYTVAGYMSGAKIMFGHFIEQDYIEVNPVKFKNHKPEIKHIATEEEIEKVLKGIADVDMYYSIVKFLVLTGFRISEMDALKWEDIYWDEGIIKVTNVKAGRDDSFPLYRELKEFLEPKRKESGKIFEIKNTRSLSTLRRRIRKYADITFHDIRRYFGTKYAKKLTQAELQKLMRHENPNTTARYYVNINIKDIGSKM